MKEISFLKQNYQKWQQFEQLLDRQEDTDPDALAEQFIQITDDLSYARTFYPNTNTEKYLNNLAARVHQQIYRNKKERRSRLITFWTTEIPALMYAQRLNLFISLLVFSISVAVGVLSAEKDPEFTRSILGDGYVSMTTHNIEQGDPMAVYKDDDQFGMFMRIMINNVRVAFFILVAGLFTQLGPLYIIFQNGVMVGVFQYFFYKQGLMEESALTIWMHGTIEMLSFVVEGAAGLALANSIYAPGSFSRGASFGQFGRNALKIAVAAVPLIVCAAFIESFITRYTEMNNVFRYILIFGMMGFMVWYYVLNPIVVHARKDAAFMTRTGKRRTLLAQILYPLLKPSGGKNMVPKITIGALFILMPVLSLTMKVITDHPIDLTSLVLFCFMITGGIAIIVYTIMTRHQVEEEVLEIERKNVIRRPEYAKK